MGHALDGLVLPNDTSVLIRNRRFWTHEVVLELFEQADEIGFTDPQAGLEIAEVTVRLVDKLPGIYRRGSEKTLLKSRAFTILGSRLRAVARLDESDRAFMLAGGLSWGAPSLDIADLLRRRGLLRVDQRQLDSALLLMDQSLRIHESERADEHRVGCVLLSRGLVFFHAERYREAICDFVVSTRLIDPERGLIDYYGAVHNLGAALVKSAGSREEVSAAIEHIRKARKIGYAPHTLPGLTLTWMEGLLLVKMGRKEEAEAAYREARSGLTRLNAPYEVALLLLDLAELLCEQGRLEELVTVAAEMFPLFGAFRANREVIAGLRMFHHAALRYEVTVNLIARVRRIVEHAARSLE